MRVAKEGFDASVTELRDTALLKVKQIIDEADISTEQGKEDILKSVASVATLYKLKSEGKNKKEKVDVVMKDLEKDLEDLNGSDE